MAARSPAVSDRYLALIREFRLRPLKNDHDWDAADAVIGKLVLRDDLTDEEQEYLEVLTELIAAYEEKTCPMPDASGIEYLRVFIRSTERTQAEFAKDVGVKPSTLSEILSGKRGLRRKHIEAIVRRFHIDPGVLIEQGAEEPVQAAPRSYSSEVNPETGEVLDLQHERSQRTRKGKRSVS